MWFKRKSYPFLTGGLYLIIVCHNPVMRCAQFFVRRGPQKYRESDTKNKKVLREKQ